MISTTNSYRIMIVDDDPNLLHMMEIVLQRAGYRVLQAASGFEALQMASNEKPDLIIMDVMMPGLDGMDSVRQLRAMPATRHIPIIMLSALEKPEDKIRGFEAGADDYVGKPVNPRELTLRVRALINRAATTQTAVTRTIAVMGAKGGVGTTTIAANTAAALVQQGKSVTLADIRPHSGGLHHHFKLNSEETSQRLLKADPDNIRRQDVDHCLVSHKSGLKLLLPPAEYHLHTLTPAHVEVILEGLSDNTDYIILDLPAMPDPAVHRALELSDQTILALEPETLSISCAEMQMQRFKAWGVFSRTDLVVVNRVRTRVSTFSQVEIETRMGMRSEEELNIYWNQPTAVGREKFQQGIISTIPSSPEMFHEAIRGRAPYVLIEPGSHAARALLDIGDWIMEKYG